MAATLMDDECLDALAISARPSREDLARAVAGV